MDRILRYAAYAACFLQIGAVGVIMLHAYVAQDIMAAFLLAIPAALCIAALWSGPDIEERRLLRQVRKLRLSAELQKLEAKIAGKQDPIPPLKK